MQLLSACSICFCVSCLCYVLLLFYDVTGLLSSYLKFEMNELVKIGLADNRKEIASLGKMFCSMV